MVAYFERLPEHNDPTVATYLVAETRGVEKFLRTAGGGRRRPPSPAPCWAHGWSSWRGTPAARAGRT
ncbi:hypothetical protein ACFQZ4_06825 [Catellatospora coxensis]